VFPLPHEPPFVASGSPSRKEHVATKKRQQTMAKREREQNVRERRAEKALKKQARSDARNAGPVEEPAVTEDAS
jgi:hypothetical protein